MKATELRIGNYLLKGGTVWKVSGIVDKTVFTNGFQFPITEFNGIPLTEEWLLKFGLERDSRGFEKFKWHRSAIYFMDNFWIYGILADDNNSYYHVSKIQYVHQLQNLYFALTGEELTIQS